MERIAKILLELQEAIDWQAATATKMVNEFADRDTKKTYIHFGAARNKWQ